MKILKGLNKKILSLYGKPLRLTTESKEDARVKNIIALSLAVQKQTASAVRALQIAFKIRDSKDTLELEDADFLMVKNAVEQDKGLTNLLAAQVLEVLDKTLDKEEGSNK